MLIFKFTKTGTAALVSHVDNLRAVTYILRRADVQAEYSQGFNPHIELGFSPPIPLGVESVAEYVSVRTAQTEELTQRLNAVCPAGVSFLRQWRAKVNLAAVVDRARYRLQAKGIGNVAESITAPGYCVTYDDRGKLVTKDMSARIFAAERVDSDTALVTLSTGNNNLRPDRLVLHLMRAHGLEGDYAITKLAAFVGDEDVDEFLTRSLQGDV